MFLEVIIDLFGNAIGIFILGFFGFIVLFYGLALVISVGVGLIVFIALNPLSWIFIIALLAGGFLIIAK
ncbi:hypothetical protein [Methanobacterium sp. BAmetb5]|uniref:hypothetical protein n=1 Tax=Methanobacterium sp. BAmetb5 TaxID=2025351 RepID=UPI000E97ABEB|nr:hypothetical protein [Methanobacterium sp. BAmetb5]AXV40400.1 MAG: hypothetical protein CIT02_08740 [Methanobacterium sp. BAmetb5]